MAGTDYVQKSEADVIDETLVVFQEELQSDDLPESKRITNFNVLSWARITLEAVAKSINIAYRWINTNLVKQVSPSTATGVWLDLWLLSTGLTRRAAVATEGYFLFSGTGLLVTTTIPAGSQIATETQSNGQRYIYLTIDDIVLTPASPSLSSGVRAISTGPDYNIPEDMTLELLTPISGVTVSNPVPTSPTGMTEWITLPGTDRESDSQARARYVLQWLSLGEATIDKHNRWALIVTGIYDAAVWRQSMNVVKHYILGDSGQPTATQLAAINDYGAQLRSLCENYEALAASPKVLNLAFGVQYDPSQTDLSVAQIKSGIEGFNTGLYRRYALDVTALTDEELADQLAADRFQLKSPMIKINETFSFPKHFNNVKKAYPFVTDFFPQLPATGRYGFGDPSNGSFEYASTGINQVTPTTSGLASSVVLTG